jgi:hypothetical protein
MPYQKLTHLLLLCYMLLHTVTSFASENIHSNEMFFVLLIRMSKLIFTNVEQILNGYKKPNYVLCTTLLLNILIDNFSYIKRDKFQVHTKLV